MDPNVTLKELRAYVRDLTQAEDEDKPIEPHKVARLVELVFAMDDWMSHGGFLPEAWER